MALVPSEQSRGTTAPRARHRRGGLSVLLSLAALAAFAPASAQAGDLNAAIRIANSIFPSVQQRCGIVNIEVAPLSSFNVGASAESYFRLCKVRYAPDTIPNLTNGQLCSLTIHEWGHLAGLPHSSDPNNFMYPQVPHNPACGPKEASVATLDEQTSRREAISDQLVELRADLRAARKAHRRAHGAKRAALARKIKRLRTRIGRLKVKLRALS